MSEASAERASVERAAALAEGQKRGQPRRAEARRPAFEGQAIHKFQLRVYFGDTDAGGIVYHSNYLDFAERARSEMVREMGISQAELLADGKGYAFAVRHVDADFIKPARLDDLLQVETEVTEVGGASLEVRQDIRRLDDAALLVRLNVRLAYISLDGRPARLPGAYKDCFFGRMQERR